MISIIIPLHNLASNREYGLKRCLDSILAQTYTDFEVLLMENGSTDDTVDVAKEYCNKDNRFKLHILDNIGVSNARNKGIELAKGEYIAFIDGDDFITNNYLQTAMKYFNIDKDVAFVQLSFIQYINKSNTIKPMAVFESSNIVSLSCDFYSTMSGNVCNKVIKMDVIKNNNIKFDITLHNFEDFFFGNEIFFNSDKAAYSNEAKYYYVQYSKNQATKNNKKMILSAIEANKKIKDFYIKYNVYDKYKYYISKNFVELFIGPSYALTWIRKLDRKTILKILKDNKEQIINLDVENKSILLWQKVWFKRFQKSIKYFGAFGGYIFIKFMRLYRNLFIQPFKIKWYK